MKRTATIYKLWLVYTGASNFLYNAWPFFDLTSEMGKNGQSTFIDC